MNKPEKVHVDCEVWVDGIGGIVTANVPTVGCRTVRIVGDFEVVEDKWT